MIFSLVYVGSNDIQSDKRVINVYENRRWMLDARF